ncbi:glycosyltransferase family 2 protein [Candidatus Tisiphia endosymbiont of Metellina segmentata]|uniref:glycosyltransferase family 2 protein n=1 Tax=Candidatus Tisiphia endosymbiont of Metellina segmentata TaxID=3066274 RepID=UPI00313B6676
MNKIINIYPKVSLVIPVYNGANYMREAIDSAVAQTYKNLEILVVNDGSNDNGETERIALSYGNKIRYFSKPNGGVASALNLAIKEMKGEYFSWLSHDDVYNPNKIEHQINILNTLPNRNTIIYGGYEVIDHNSKSLSFIRPDKILSAKKCNIPLFPLMRGLIHGCALLIPIKYFCEIGTFDETLLTTQDYALWFEFLRIAPIHFDDHILIKSRTHLDQGTHKITSHMNECSELWSRFLRRLTLEEMTIMEGSPYLFLHRTSIFLAYYQQPSKLAESMANALLADIKISVIMPIYNRIDLAIESIKSVIAQTHQCFELIIVDDGSEDDVSRLIEECNKDSRIKYIRKENAGPAAARNLGIKHASGQYIAFIDSDDLFYDNKLEVQLKFMEDNSLLFSHTSYHRIDWAGNLIKYISSGTFSKQVFPNIITKCPITMSSVMGKTSLFMSNKFPENIGIGEDVCLWISIASKYEIGAIDIALSKVRINYSTTTCLNTKKTIIGLINIASFVMNDEYLSQFDKQVQLLLFSAANISSLPLDKLIKFNDWPSEKRNPNIVVKLIRSLRVDGFRITWNKICRKLGILQ